MDTLEQTVFTKLNLYDQVGYLTVGAIAALIFVFDATYFYHASIPPFNLNTFLLWFIVTYFVGHLIQGIANLINETPLLNFLTPENKKNFTEAEKEILQQVKKYSQLEGQSEKELWNICYMFALVKDATGQVQTFNANYGLYRGWLVVFILQSVFLLYAMFLAYSQSTLILFIASIFLGYVFYERTKRFWKYTRDKALETFVIVNNFKPQV